MVTDRADGVHPPFEGFTVVTTVKPDGRLIHYYEWPPAAADPESAPSAGDGAPGSHEPDPPDV